MVLVAAIILFALAAMFGLVLLISILQDIPTPKPSVFIHGGLAILGLGLVTAYVIIQGYSSALITALVLLIIAASGGLFLFARDMRNKSIPKWLALLHPLIAFAGLIALIICLLP